MDIIKNTIEWKKTISKFFEKESFYGTSLWRSQEIERSDEEEEVSLSWEWFQVFVVILLLYGKKLVNQKERIFNVFLWIWNIHSKEAKPTDLPDRMSFIEKQYIQSDEIIINHPVWKLHGFWKTALKEDIFRQESYLDSVLGWTGSWGLKTGNCW